MKSLIKKIAAALIAACMVFTVAVPAMAAAQQVFNVTPMLTVRSNIVAGKLVEEQTIHYPITQTEPVGEGDIYIGISEASQYRDVYTITDVEYVTSESHRIAMGEEIKIRATLEITGGNIDTYKFGSSCKINGATNAGYSRQSDRITATVTIKLKAASGKYDDPQEAYWGNSLGQAKWTAPDFTSGYYEVNLRRGGSSVGTVVVHGTSCSFYYKDWMGKKGDYSFRVRTVPNPNASNAKSSWRSDYTESDEQFIDSNQVATANGSPQSAGSNPGSGDSGIVQAGWQKSDGKWYYRFPDGTYKKNGWEKITGKWYLFDGSGAMITGWQTLSGQTYYLDAVNGDMKTGWVSVNGTWYFLNMTPGSLEGALVKNAWITDGGHRYFMTENGSMAMGWVKIGDKYYYFRPEAGNLKGTLVVSQYVGTFYVGADGAWIENY